MVNIGQDERIDVKLPSGKKTFRNTQLSNELMVLTGFIDPDSDRPVASAHLFAGAGNWHDPEDQYGLAHMNEHMSLERTTRLRTRQEIARFVRQNGSYMNAETIEICTRFDLWTLDTNLFLTLPIFLEGVIHPAYVPRELETEIGVVTEEIRRTRGNPVDWSELLTKGRLFGLNPFAFYGLGSIKGVKSITVGDLERFRATHYSPRNMTLSVVSSYEYPSGTLDERADRFHQDVLEIAERAFQNVHNTSPRQQPAPRKVKIEKSYKRHSAQGLPNTYLFKGRRNGHSGNELSHTSMELLAAILSNRINDLRDEHGISYEAKFDYTTAPENMLWCRTSCAPRFFPKLADVIRRAEEAAYEGVPQQEFETSRGWLMNQTRIKYNNGQGRAREILEARLGYPETFDGEIDALRAIAPDDVRKAAQHVFSLPYAQITLGRKPKSV